ncbi:MAG: 30S ribosome-binding factor RbfA [Bacteroidetes bacterium]|nr:MAG: 30S ribosome-binding factor RbfA [Bacteroidota bacterium]
MSIRTERVASMLQREIAEILRHDFASEIQHMITVTGVRVTNDLGIAYIYVSVFGDDDINKQDALDELKSLSVRVRKTLAGIIRHQLKGVPELRFFLDDSLAEAARLEELFGKIHSHDEPSASDV